MIGAIGLVKIVAGWLAIRLVGRIMMALGLSVVTYNGMDSALAWIEAEALLTTNALPAEVLNYMGLMKVDICLTIFFTAMAYKITFMSVKQFAGRT